MVDLKELKKLIKYLRKEGVTEFKSDGIEFKLGNPPETKRKSVKRDVSEAVNIDTDGPTQDELLFWSADTSMTPKDS